jgi:hypothetical protein
MFFTPLALLSLLTCDSNSTHEYSAEGKPVLTINELNTSFTLYRRPNTSSWSPELTEEDIAQAAVLSTFLSSPRKILKVGSNIVAKLAPDLDMTEVESMTFIRQYTTIPVPKVLNAYEKAGCLYILMEFVEGDMLEQAWPNLSSSQRSVIMSELKDYIRQMRQIANHLQIIHSVKSTQQIYFIHPIQLHRRRSDLKPSLHLMQSRTQ